MRYFLRLITYLAIFFFSLSVSYVFIMRYIPATITPLKIVKLFDNRADYGVVIDSHWRSLGKINMSMVKAVMASEDNNFLTHHGFDWEAIDMAIEYNKKGKKLRGASTISQQTAKNMFCKPSRTWFRKGVETYFTLLIEVMWSKNRIMEVYLNVIEVRPNVYGVEAAAQNYFNKEAKNLNNYDAAMIATVLPNPARMNLEAPSAYMKSRAARIRTMMKQLPPVDFADTTDSKKPKK